MGKHAFDSRILGLAALLLLVLGGTPLGAKPFQPAPRAGQGGGAGFDSGIVGIVEGQAALVSVRNTGAKASIIGVLIVNPDGKILSMWEGAVPPGKTASVAFAHPGGVNRLELDAVIQLDDRKDLDRLVPSLQVYDEGSGRTAIAFAANDFLKLGHLDAVSSE